MERNTRTVSPREDILNEVHCEVCRDVLIWDIVDYNLYEAHCCHKLYQIKPTVFQVSTESE